MIGIDVDSIRAEHGLVSGTHEGRDYNRATTNCVVLITSQDKKPIQATLQSNAMHKIKVAELYNPRLRERTDTDPSFVGPSFILGSQENPQGKA
jgi:hypothetical protein